MNAVWNSYGQLCGCPEIFKKSCKFFCRELDIRVPEVVKAKWCYTRKTNCTTEPAGNLLRCCFYDASFDSFYFFDNKGWVFDSAVTAICLWLLD